MNSLKNLFKKEKQQKEEFHTKHPSNEALFLDEWEAVPEYIPTSSGSNEIMNVISATIITNNQPRSRFIVRSIQGRNPEAVLVSMIVTSIVTGGKEKPRFIARKIIRKKEKQLLEVEKMLRKFRSTIDGKRYLVEMEETSDAPQQLSMPSQSIVQKLISQVEETLLERETASLTSIAQGADDTITVPVLDTILRILVDNREAVRENQPLAIPEAMKMENEIVTGKAGIVAAIRITAGDMVNLDDALIIVS